MLHYWKDDKGILHCASGELDISDQRSARNIIELETNIRVKTAVLTLVVDNPTIDAPAVA